MKTIINKIEINIEDVSPGLSMLKTKYWDLTCAECGSYTTGYTPHNVSVFDTNLEKKFDICSDFWLNNNNDVTIQYDGNVYIVSSEKINGIEFIRYFHFDLEHDIDTDYNHDKWLYGILSEIQRNCKFQII